MIHEPRSSLLAHSSSMFLITLIALTPHRYLDGRIALHVSHICDVNVKRNHTPRGAVDGVHYPRIGGENSTRSHHQVESSTSKQTQTDLSGPGEAMQVSLETSIQKNTSRRARQGIPSSCVGLRHTSERTLDHGSHER